MPYTCRWFVKFPSPKVFLKCFEDFDGFFPKQYWFFFIFLFLNIKWTQKVLCVAITDSPGLKKKQKNVSTINAHYAPVQAMISGKKKLKKNEMMKAPLPLAKIHSCHTRESLKCGRHSCCTLYFLSWQIHLISWKIWKITSFYFENIIDVYYYKN